MQELHDLCKNLNGTKWAIEDGVDKLEKGMKVRDLKRKEILLSEMKQVLGLMAETDNRIVKDLKGEAFDMMRSLNRIADDIASLRAILAENPLYDAQLEFVTIKNKFKSLGLDEFLGSLDISVSIQPVIMTSAFEKISDAIFLNSPELNSKQFFLEIPEKLTSFQPIDNNPEYVDINIYAASESITFTPMVLQKLQIEVTGQMLDEERVILEESSVWSMLEKMKSKILKDQACVTVQLRRPNNIFGKISVSVLGSNIVNSPVLCQFVDNESKAGTLTDETIGIFDMTTGVDESNLASLDMITRREMQHQQLMSSHTFPGSPAQGHRKISREPSSSSKPQCWQTEDSVWDDALDTELSDGEDTHPHLMLNASKAPPAGADWPTVDPTWNSNITILSDVLQSVNQDKNQTVWGEKLLNHADNFNFLNGSLMVEDIFKSHKIAVNSRSGTIDCLESPSCMTYLPEKQTFLVTEPSYNRVGLYEVASFQFVCWMGYPEQVGNGRTCYNYPTSVLALDNGYVVLLEKDLLHIFDGQFCHFQSIRGEFHGLTEGPTGEILTISKNRKQDIVLKKLVREVSASMLITDHRSPYILSGQIKLDVIQTFNKWGILSKAQFLTYSQGKVFITDLGLHKLYTLNLTTGEQSESGYMGSQFGQFKQPTGLVADDEGNLIVGDSENNRLVVVNKKGQLVKVVPQNQGMYWFPHDLVRVDNSLMAVYMGTKGDNQGVIVRYRMVE